MTPTEESSLLREKLRELQTENEILRQIVMCVYLDSNDESHINKIEEYLKAYPQKKPLDE